MSEQKVSVPLKGGWAVFGFVGLLLMMGYRASNIANVRDPVLVEKVQRELQNEVGNRLSSALKAPENKNDLRALAELASSKATVHSVRVSEPLWSFSSKTKAVLKVEYSLPGSPARHVKYFKALDSLITGWQIHQETTVISYYLNFF